MRRCPVLLIVVFLLARAAAGLEIVVSETADPFGSNGLCSLREALFAATFDVAVDGCPAGEAGLDRIWLGTFVFELRGEIVLSGADPFLVVAAGPGTEIRPEPGNRHRLFSFVNGTQAAFERVTLRGGDVRSPTGQGVGKGGAIFGFDADLRLTDCVVTGNRANTGGGVYLGFSGDPGAPASHLLVERTVFEGNSADQALGTIGQAYGGGLSVAVSGASTARIVDSSFLGNSVAASAGNVAGGGGLSAEASSAGARLDLLRVRFEGNAGNAGGAAEAVYGAGAIVAAHAASVTIRDAVFRANDVALGSAESSTGLSLGVSGPVRLDRVRFRAGDVGEARRHVEVFVDDGQELVATNLLIADGPATGLWIVVAETGSARLGHLTVTRHAAIGLDVAAAAGAVRLQNSILWNDGEDLVVRDGAPILESDLVGVDPLFVDPEHGNFQLDAGSPAVGTGDRTLASVGFADAVHAPRVAGAQTDIGAFERRGIFADDFEVGDAGGWSNRSQ